MHSNNSFILHSKSFRSLFPTISHEEIDIFFDTHPEPISLKAIQDFLIGQGIDSKAYKLPQEMLKELKVPFVAHLKDHDEFVVAKSFVKEEIKVATDKGNIIQSIEEFKKRWTGIVLLISEDAKKPVSGYLKKGSKLKIWIKNNLDKLFFITLAISLILILGSLGIKSILLTLLIIPLYASYSLVNIENGQYNDFDKLICFAGKRVNCETVIKSPISRLFGGISLSYFGLFYFIFLITLLFVQYYINTSASLIFQTITAFCLLAMPISLYLIIYQGVKIGRICPYCMSIQIIVILLGGCFFVDSFFPSISIGNVNLTAILFALFVSLLLTAILSKTLKIKNNLNYYKKSFLKFKRNPMVFNNMLLVGKNKLLPANELILKSSEGVQNICFVLDLSCNHCLGAVKEYIHIKSCIQNIGLSITFMLDVEQEIMYAGFIDKLFLMRDKGDDWLNELNNWYSSKEYVKANINLPSDYKRTKQIIAFTRENDLRQSPVLIINNTILSNDYTYYDLSDMLHILYS